MTQPAEIVAKSSFNGRVRLAIAIAKKVSEEDGNNDNIDALGPITDVKQTVKKTCLRWRELAELPPSA